MFNLVFSLVFLIVAALFMLVGALRGKKKRWELSVTRIALSVISAIIAAFVASLVAWNVIGALMDGVLGIIPQAEEIINELPSGKDIITALASMIVAPSIFLIIYLIIRLIAMAFTKLIARQLLKLTKLCKKKSAVVEAEKPENTEQTENGIDRYSAEFSCESQAEDKRKNKKAQFNLEKNNWVGALCGALCSFVTLCVIMVPFVGFSSAVGDVAAEPLQSSALQEINLLSTVGEVADGAANNAGAFTVKAIGGGLLYDAMTTYEVDGRKTTFKNELKLVGAFADAATSYLDEDAKNEEKAQKIREVSVAFEKSEIVPIAIAELTGAASGDWKEGKDFHGIEQPSMGEALDPLVNSLVEAFAQSDNDTIKDDFEAVVEIMAILMEKDALQSFEKNPLVMVSNEETTAKVLQTLLENPRLNVLVDGVSDFGITILMSAVGATQDVAPLYEQFKTEIKDVPLGEKEDMSARYAEIYDKYGLKVSKEQCDAAVEAVLGGKDILAWTGENVVADSDDYANKTLIVSVKAITDGRADIENKEAEAKALARAYAQVYELVDKMSSSSLSVNDMLVEMGPVFDCFKATESIGEQKTANILKTMLQAQTVRDRVGFTLIEASDSADSISKNSATKSYAAMLNSLILAVEMVEAASDPEMNTKDAVDKMLADLSPESAEVLQTIATPDVMKKYGTPEKSAKPTAKLMSDTFGNLADAKQNGMSDEQYSKESAAVANMMSVAMSSGKGSVFGEYSATGITADQFVADIMNSTVMSDTLVETVYGEGVQPKLDPLASDRTMSENENADFINALNNSWNSSDKSEKAEREIISIASMLNVNVKITESGVQQIAAE